MRLNAGIVTEKLTETKTFYVDKLGFGVVWEADWFLLLSTPNGADTIGFLTPNHPTQAIEHFRRPFTGAGVYFTIEVDDVDALYTDFQQRGIDIELSLRSEEWGDRHFVVVDPNGIGVDFVTYSERE